MFYFLVLTGTALVLFGCYSRKKQQVEGVLPVHQAAKPKVQEDAADAGMAALQIRMDQIEKLVFQSLMVHGGRKAEVGTGSVEGLDLASGQLAVNSTGTVSATSAEAVSGEADSAHAVHFSAAKPSAGHGREEGFTPMSVETLEETRHLEVPKRKPMPDNIRAIADYEKQGLSVQEIAKVTRMKKGEVLLLKNLSKHYFK